MCGWGHTVALVGNLYNQKIFIYMRGLIRKRGSLYLGIWC